MRTIFTLFFIVAMAATSFSQKKQTVTPQPYSISDIKLGMSMGEFLQKHTDSIYKKETSKSTTILAYANFKLNNSQVYEVMVRFYKDKLITFTFKTNDSAVHTGLTAKYGYNKANEQVEYFDDEEALISNYGQLNNSYQLIYGRFSNYEMIYMEDIKNKKLSDAEGF